MSQDHRSILVVGYDGSHAATAAVRWAAEQARECGGRVVVLHARRAGGLVPINAETRGHARAGLEALWMQEDALIDAEVELRVAHDHPAASLCRAAAELDADGIVIGRHQSGPFASDTVAQVLRLTDRPVTVIP